MEFKKGELVKIPAGTLIEGIDGKPEVTKREQTIDVYRFLPAIDLTRLGLDGLPEKYTYPPIIEWQAWPRWGSYVKRVNANLVERISDENN